MAAIRIIKANAIPDVWVPNAIYFIKETPDHFRQYVVDIDGVVALKAYTDVANVTFDRYDLPIASTKADGIMDLSKNQIFLIDSTVTTPVTMNFTNKPAAGRTMIVIVEVRGNARAVTVPPGTVVADGVDNSLGNNTVLTFYVNGNSMNLMSVAKLA